MKGRKDIQEANQHAFSMAGEVLFELFDFLADEQKFLEVKVERDSLKEELENERAERKEFSNIAHRIRHDANKLASLDVANLTFLLEGNKEIIEGCMEKTEEPGIKEALEECSSTLDAILNSLSKTNDPVKEQSTALDRVISIFDGNGDKPTIDETKGEKIFGTIKACVNDMHIKNLNLNLDNEISEETFFTDFRKIRDSVVNLISNAKEAGADTINVNVSLDDKSLIIEIEDNGKGISEDIISKVLSTEKFTTKSSTSAHGYGMQSVVINIEEALAGKVELVRTSTDEKDHGTKFRLIIPRN
ncbi:MAG: HAMP domain-containing histidine kinase [Candidatus Diapherotrites archaeon]|nr:HAMP domain-containing histidine kinase [Candidatus Diapherotrites archaeon]